MKEITIDLIRHGEPQGGARYRGDGIDDPLSEKGWQQMWKSVGEDASWDAVISSPMIRCRAFAEQLGSRHDINVTIERDFREVGFGAWEGLNKNQVRERNLQEYEDFYSDPINNRPQGAEPIDDFIDRVTCAYDKLITEYPGKHCLIVGHAGVIRAIISHALGAGPETLYRIAVKNAAIARIQYSEGRGVLESLNRR
ncbi:MAG: histidine phosphatase family protein [Thiothrix sp.]|nr:MAG: histidine phosphatase family protein [Thiothrix sp.]